MKKLVFASNTPHKLEEIRAILSGQVEVISLAELGCYDDIAETADSLEGNALIKARYIWEHYGCHCFADDTGLEVAALDGAPGVRSARFAGDAASSEDNVSLLLERLGGVASPRRARFRTVIALIDGYGTHFFEGTVEGEILTELRRAQRGREERSEPPRPRRSTPSQLPPCSEGLSSLIPLLY